MSDSDNSGECVPLLDQVFKEKTQCMQSVWFVLLYSWGCYRVVSYTNFCIISVYTCMHLYMWKIQLNLKIQLGTLYHNNLSVVVFYFSITDLI